MHVESGRITALVLKRNGVCWVIQIQQHKKSAIDGVVVVDSETVCNNMYLAMCTLASKLSLKNHFSFRTEKNLEVRETFRTNPICGNLLKHPRKDVVGIDVSMAYTAALCDLAEVPILGEPDALH